MKFESAATIPVLEMKNEIPDVGAKHPFLNFSLFFYITLKSNKKSFLRSLIFKK